MHDFTSEEKELIASTPITAECFDMDGFFNVDTGTWLHSDLKSMWEELIEYLETLRQDYACGFDEGDEQIFTELVRLLPNSYKVVKL